MAVKLDKKTEKRIEEISKWLDMSPCETEKTLIEVGLCFYENKFKEVRNAKTSNKMQSSFKNYNELENARNSNS